MTDGVPGVTFTWGDVVALRNDLVQHGLPDDPADVRVRLAQAVYNAEGLRVLFAGPWDEGSRQYVYELIAEYHVAVEWRSMTTNSTSSTRN